MKKYRYHYYEIRIPGDCYENIEYAKSAAIDEARDRAKLYIIPCNWWAQLLNSPESVELIFKVCRISRNPKCQN